MGQKLGKEYKMDLCWFTLKIDFLGYGDWALSLILGTCDRFPWPEPWAVILDGWEGHGSNVSVIAGWRVEEAASI